MKFNKNDYDFGGWASKNDLRCADGRIIRKGAFSANNGQKVPLVWQHNHTTTSAVLGHALLEERDEGIYAWGSFNNTKAGREAKEQLMHGDINALSIWANNLQQAGKEVIHGAIREVSLVLAGANPGAFIESVISHGYSIEEDEDEGIFYTGENIKPIVAHAATPSSSSNDEPDEEDDSEESYADIYNKFTPKQKEAVAAILAEVMDDEGGEEMAHSIFEGDDENYLGDSFLSHDDMREIFKDARRTGSLRESFYSYVEDNELEHAIPTTGMITPSTSTAGQTYGVRDVDMLLPDYRAVDTKPDFISRDMEWVAKVMSGVTKVPFARIKTLHADITEDEARAKGYIKGKLKKEEVFTLLKRTTDPQTVYKKQKLDKDDIEDVTDFDMVLWLKGEMQVMFNEEIARAILIGDGRASDAEDKIKPDHIRPIAEDVDLYNVKIEVTAGADETATAKNFIKSVIKSRKKYKGSGNPTLFTTEDMLTDMLLIENQIGERIYKTVQELATALRVSSIETVEVMEGHRTSSGAEVLGIIVNLVDYRVGRNKTGSENDIFEDFDIDYNQYKYLIERRMSGALAKPFSAMTITKAAAPATSQQSSTKSNSILNS